MKRQRDNKKPFKGKAGDSTAEDPDLLPPVFSFEKMQKNTGFSIDCCDQGNQCALIKRLFHLSDTTWRQIRHAHRHGIGTEIIGRNDLKVALPQTVTEDATILALRYNGKRPMLGYRDGRIFYVLFVDHDFSAYNHG